MILLLGRFTYSLIGSPICDSSCRRGYRSKIFYQGFPRSYAYRHCIMTYIHNLSNHDSVLPVFILCQLTLETQSLFLTSDISLSFIYISLYFSIYPFIYLPAPYIWHFLKSWFSVSDNISLEHLETKYVSLNVRYSLAHEYTWPIP